MEGRSEMAFGSKRDMVGQNPTGRERRSSAGKRRQQENKEAREEKKQDQREELCCKEPCLIRTWENGVYVQKCLNCTGVAW